MPELLRGEDEQRFTNLHKNCSYTLYDNFKIIILNLNCEVYGYLII